MKTSKILSTAIQLYEKMKLDGYNPTVIDTTKWVIQHFSDYCAKNGIEAFQTDTVACFIHECYGFDFYKPTLPIHSMLRRPVLILMDFEKSGNYPVHYSTYPKQDIPQGFKPVFLEYHAYMDTLDYSKDTKARRMADFKKYVNYLYEHGIFDIKDAERTMVYSFINDIKGNYSPKTMKTLKYSLRLLHDWLYSSGYLSYDGKMVFPWIQNAERSSIPSCYSKEEVKEILDTVNTETPKGKFSYCVLCLAAYLGMRSGDIINLKFSDIDWPNNRIHYVQTKTLRPLTLPLMDEVKYPLIDYIRNARKNTSNDEFIFIRMKAPFTRYQTGTALCSIVTQALADAGIDATGRHHGPHALRHSLASSLLSEDVQVCGISDILGHANTMSTEIYLTIDETHLKELTLEVPGYEN